MEIRKPPAWWGAPKNFDDRVNERKVSWLELFYDLVYVAAIGQLTHHIALNPCWPVFFYSFLLFCLVFWSWVNGSQYYDLHGDESIRTRLTTFWQMLAVAAVAVTLPDAFAGNHQSFAIAFSVIEALIIYLWWSVGLYDPSHRKFNIYYSINYSIALALLIISVFTDHNTATILWVLVLILNVTPPFTGANTIITELKKRGQIFTASETIVERFGLFTIIVLAESILAIVTAIAEIKDKHPAIWVAFMLSILIAFLLWSIYFDMTSEQETKKGYWYMQALIFFHFPLLGSLSVVGACLKVLLTNMDTNMLQVQWMFCVTLSIILFMVVGITKIMEEEEEQRTYSKPVSRVLIVAGIALLIIPLFGSYLNTLAFLAVISVILFVPVFIGINIWIRFKFFQ